jgi:hypothetical protein
MVTEELPPDIEDEPPLHEPTPDPSEDEFTDHGYRIVPGTYPNSGIDDPERPYQDLGGLTRPDAYFGAKEFDCPPKEVGGCGAPKGERCRVWVERLDRDVARKMPCVKRIKLAREAGLI